MADSLASLEGLNWQPNSKPHSFYHLGTLRQLQVGQVGEDGFNCKILKPSELTLKVQTTHMCMSQVPRLLLLIIHNWMQLGSNNLFLSACPCSKKCSKVKRWFHILSSSNFCKRRILLAAFLQLIYQTRTRKPTFTTFATTKLLQPKIRNSSIAQNAAANKRHE